MLLQGDRERLLQLLYLQISVRVRQELREMALHQIVDGSCELWNLHDLLIGQLPNKPSRASSPEFTGWKPPSWGQYRASFKDWVGLNQRTFHEDRVLANDALGLNGARAQQTVGTHCHIPIDKCLSWKPCKQHTLEMTRWDQIQPFPTGYIQSMDIIIQGGEKLKIPSHGTL